MGRTIKSATMQFMEEAGEYAKYRRALRKEDQIVFDTLMSYARRHLAESAQAADALPFETMLLSMLLEVCKQNELLRLELEEIQPMLELLAKVKRQQEWASEEANAGL